MSKPREIEVELQDPVAEELTDDQLRALLDDEAADAFLGDDES